MEGRHTKKIFGALKLASMLIVVAALIGMSLFVGLMTATAGIAIYPPLTNITAPLACEGEFTIESKTYSKYPGESVVTHTFYCQEIGSNTKTDISMRAALIVFGVSSTLIFLISLVIAVVVIGVGYVAIRRYGRITPPAAA